MLDALNKMFSMKKKSLVLIVTSVLCQCVCVCACFCVCMRVCVNKDLTVTAASLNELYTIEPPEHHREPHQVSMVGLLLVV